MKRELRFRAFDKREGLQRMFYNVSFVPYGEGWNDGNPEYKFYEITFGSGGFMKATATDIEIMQYVGLKDKNQKDIYEGDIIEFDKNGKGDIPYDGEHKIRKTPVYWNDFRASWSVKFSDLANNDLFKYHLMCEVIGNIYQNENLLQTPV